MQTYDLCLCWYWQYDEDFARYLDEACREHSRTLWQIRPGDLLEAVSELYNGEGTFQALLDRADDDLRFEPIRRFACENGIRRVNPSELSHWSEDKATMHLELIQAGLQTPYTILLAPFIEQPLLPSLDLTPLGERFVIKPAVGGGGEGVWLAALSQRDIQRARLEFPDHKYLVQAHIQARSLSGREAWFRVYYVGGDCFPCWWSPSTHAFTILTPEEEGRFELGALRQITERIAGICRLDWFSTEIALTNDGRFVVVDYVNDGIDTRVQSRAADGMPDEVLRWIADRLVTLTLSQ